MNQQTKDLIERLGLYAKEIATQSEKVRAEGGVGLDMAAHIPDNFGTLYDDLHRAQDLLRKLPDPEENLVVGLLRFDAALNKKFVRTERVTIRLEPEAHKQAAKAFAKAGGPVPYDEVGPFHVVGRYWFEPLEESKSEFAPPYGKNVVGRLSSADFEDIKGVICRYCRLKIPDTFTSGDGWEHSIPGDDAFRRECLASDFRCERGGA